MTEEHDPMWEPDEDESFDPPGGCFLLIIFAICVCWSAVMMYIGSLIGD